MGVVRFNTRWLLVSLTEEGVRLAGGFDTRWLLVGLTEEGVRYDK